MYNLVDLLAFFVSTWRATIGIAIHVSYFPRKVDDWMDMVAIVSISFLPTLQALKLLRRFQLFQLLRNAFSEIWEALPFLLYLLFLVVMSFGAVLFLLEQDNFVTISTA